MKDISYTSIKKILAIINSCQTDEQLKECKKNIDDYIKVVAKKITNSVDLKERLYRELEEREEAFYLVKILDS
jgi:hypothetical protein